MATRSDCLRSTLAALDLLHRVVRPPIRTIVWMAAEAAVALGADCFLIACGQPLVLWQRRLQFVREARPRTGFAPSRDHVTTGTIARGRECRPTCSDRRSGEDGTRSDLQAIAWPSFPAKCWRRCVQAFRYGQLRSIGSEVRFPGHALGSDRSQ